MKELNNYLRAIDWGQSHPSWVFRIATESDSSTNADIALPPSIEAECATQITDIVTQILIKQGIPMSATDIKLQVPWRNLNASDDDVGSIISKLKQKLDLKLSDDVAKRTITTPQRAIEAAQKFCIRQNPLKASPKLPHPD